METKKKDVYGLATEFLKKYPFTISWRIKQHSKILEKHLNPDEEIYYLFVAQKNPNPFDFFCTCLVALTNKRILIGQKRVFFGYNFFSAPSSLYCRYSPRFSAEARVRSPNGKSSVQGISAPAATS